MSSFVTCVDNYACTYVSFRRPSGIDKEFFVQLFVEPVEGLAVVYTQDLLNKMFLDQNISFVKV